MRNAISTSKITGTLLIAGLAIILIGDTAAHADGLTAQQRAQQEMNSGKDYTAAWAAATRAVAPAYSEAQIARAGAAERAMNEGKDYSSAWNATSPATAYAPDQIAKAKRVQEELHSGKDYVAAWQAADRVQSTRVPAVRPATAKAVGPAWVGGSDRTNTMK